MSYRARINQLLRERQTAMDVLEQEKKAWVAADEEVSQTQDAQRILQTVAQAVQQEAHTRISSVVCRCLEAVFEDPYRFEIRFEQKRGKTDANLVLIRGDLVLEDPLNEAGGGATDVAAFALRLACLILERPARRPVLILDEPFRNIRGVDNRKRMRRLLQSLAEDFGVQFILNIDLDSYPEFALGKVIEMEK